MVDDESRLRLPYTCSPLPSPRKIPTTPCHCHAQIREFALIHPPFPNGMPFSIQRRMDGSIDHRPSTTHHPPSTAKIELHNAYICYVRDAASGSDRKCRETSLSPHIPCAAELSGGEVVTCTAAEDEQIRSVSQQTSDRSDLSTISVSPTAKTPDTPVLLARILVYGSCTAIHV